MTRQCGQCTLCCKLLPVVELKKKAGERCQHARGLGCRIYHDRPRSCRIWSCQWLSGDGTEGLARPDHSHYVIDAMPDFITIRDDNTGTMTRVPVLQIWVDPQYPDAHRDPALREFLALCGERNGMAALVRYDSGKGITLFPPTLASDHQWHEVESGEIDPQHDATEVLELMR